MKSQETSLVKQHLSETSKRATFMLTSSKNKFLLCYFCFVFTAGKAEPQRNLSSGLEKILF